MRDQAVATACTAEKRILVTLDLDFADMRSYGSSEAPGIIVMRLPRQDAIEEAEREGSISLAALRDRLGR